MPHVIVGAGDGALVLAVGSRVGPEGVVYPVDETALQHGAGVRRDERSEGGVREVRQARLAPRGRCDGVPRGVPAGPAKSRSSWPSRRTSCTRRWTSSSRGPSTRCPSTCGRSTCTDCTRITGSSSRSSSRCCSTATSRAARTCSTRSPAPGTTLVQALESGLDATGVELAAFNCLLIGVKTAPYDVDALGVELRDVVRAAGLAAGEAPRDDARTCASGTRREAIARAARVPRPDRRVRAPRRPARRSSRAPRARRAAPRTSISRRRASRRRASTGATSTSGCAGPSRRRSASCAATRSTRSRASRRSRTIRDAACAASVAARRRAHGRVRRDVRRRLTSPPYPGLIDYHEQHRYAYELLGLDDRARARARRRGGRDVARRDRRVHARASRARSRTPPPRCVRGAPLLDRRQRPPRPLSGDPRARGPASRASGCAVTSTAAPAVARASTSKTCSSCASSDDSRDTSRRVASKRARTRSHPCARRSRAASRRGRGPRQGRHCRPS